MQGPRATEFIYYTPMTAVGSRDQQVAPTIAAGDFQVSTDGGAFSNLDTLPTVSPGGSSQVEITLSVAEMTGTAITVKAVDVAGAEWEDDFWEIRTDGANALWDALKANHVIADTFGEIVQSPQVITGAAINSAAASYALATGTQSSGTYADTAGADGTEHQHTDDAGAMDLYYQFAIGGDGTPTAAQLLGRLNSANDSVEVHAYNWNGSDWDQIGTLGGQGSSFNAINSYALLPAHVGTGANIGLVRIRFYAASGLTTATLSVDQLLVQYAVTSRTVGYEFGAVWIDTSASNTSTELYVSGTADNPVSTIAAATTIATALGLKRFEVAPHSSITLAQAYVGYSFYAPHSTIALGGQDVDGAAFVGATITGNDSGTNAEQTHYEHCTMAGNTLGQHELLRCKVTGDIVLAEAGDVHWHLCASGVPGTATPSFDFGAAVGDTDFSCRTYSGGLEVRNMGGAGTDTMSYEGMGQLVIAASCSGGTIAIRGMFSLTDNAGGAVTLEETARITVESIDTELTANHGADSWKTEAAGARAITITVEDQSTNPVPSCSVDVYDATNTTLISKGVTNASGVVAINLDDATYVVRLSRYLFTPDDASEDLVVTADAAVTYSGTIWVVPSATDPSLCRVSGYLRGVDSTLLAGKSLRFWPNAPTSVANTQIGLPVVQVDTDGVAGSQWGNGAGYFQVDLIREIVVRVQSKDAGIDQVRTVPDAASQDFATWVAD